jgi:branched-chain amino acid aminotransferase
MFKPKQTYFISDNKLHTTQSNMCVIAPPPNHIYEVFRAIRGVPLFIEDHLKRLEYSAQSLQFEIDAFRILQDVETLIRVNNSSDGNIKIIVWKELSNQHILVFYDQHKYPTSNEIENGICLGVLHKERNNPNVKLFDNEMRKDAAKLISDEFVYEVILINELGNITEGSRSNLFLVRNNIVYTPPEEDVLQGVTRQKVIEIINRHRINIALTNIAFDDIHKFESMFISGTSRRVLPVKNIQGINIVFDVNHPLLRFIEKEFLKLTDSYVRNYISQKSGK